MSRTLDEIVGEYDFDADDATDAHGLGEFIVAAMSDKNIIRDDEITVYVYDDQGRAAKKAALVRQTMSDGSTVVEMTITFDRQYD